MLRGLHGAHAKLSPCDCMVTAEKDGKATFVPDIHREVDMILRYRDEQQRDEEAIPF